MWDGHMAIAQSASLYGVWGGAPNGVQGQSPWSEAKPPLKLKTF